MVQTTACLGRRREHTAGTDLVLLSKSSISVSHPDGRRETLAVRDGRAVLAGLDSQGITTLTSEAAQPMLWFNQAHTRMTFQLSRAKFASADPLSTGLRFWRVPFLLGLIAFMMGTARRTWLWIAVVRSLGAYSIGPPLVEFQPHLSQWLTSLGRCRSRRPKRLFNPSRQSWVTPYLLESKVMIEKRIVEPGQVVQMTGGPTD